MFSGHDRKIYQSTENVGRGFCGKCGTPLTWETVFDNEGSICAVHISTFDNPELMIPTAHSFYPERIPWFDVQDNQPRHEGFVAGSEPLCYGPAD